MSRDPACCVLSDTAQTVAKILCDRNVGSMPVVADQQSRKLVGMITDRDLCCDGQNIETCERLMQEHQVRRIPIVDAEDRVIGIVSQADLTLQDKQADCLHSSGFCA